MFVPSNEKSAQADRETPGTHSIARAFKSPHLTPGQPDNTVQGSRRDVVVVDVAIVIATVAEAAAAPTAIVPS